MQCGNFMKELNQSIPTRTPGSNELTRVIETIKEKSAEFGLDPEATVIPVYSIQTSINIFIIINLLLMFLCLAAPVIGLIGQIVLLGILFVEIYKPILAKLKTEHTTNLIFNIPARSKEIQKVVLTTSLATDHFIDPSTELSPKVYLRIIYILGGLPAFLQFVAVLTGARWVTLLTLIPLATLTFLPFVKRKTVPVQTLNNGEVLLELGAILAKARPATTSVTLVLNGSRSFNSGILPVDAYLKGNELGYVINLIDYPDKRINISASEGIIRPLPSDPVFMELLLDVSREKNIPTQTAQLNEWIETYPLKLKKIKALTLTNPLLNQGGADSNRDLRELLIGFIRKIDRPS